MSGQSAVCRSDIRVVCATVGGVRAQHIKMRRGVSLDPSAAQALKEFFTNSEHVAGDRIVVQVASRDPKWPIVYTVAVRDDVTDEIAKQIGNSRLDLFVKCLRNAARRPGKIDHRDPHRRPAALRGQPTFAQA